MKHLGTKALIVAFAIVSATAQAISPNAGADRKTNEVVPNWEAPATWAAPAQAQDPAGARQDAEAAAAMGLRSALIVTPPTPVLFVPVTPCRVIDTRSGSGFPAGYGPPSLTGGGTQRTFTIAGQCGVPAGAAAVSFNFAVWFPTSRGDIRVFPGGTATPTVSTLNWEPGIAAIANAAVVPLGTGGAITVQMDATAALTDIFVDVNGYYGPTGTLPNFANYISVAKAATEDFIFPLNSSVTMPDGGACFVTATTQFTHGATVPTTQGPYFRIAIQRGAAAPVNDGQFGMYSQPGLTRSPMATRHSIIQINANETTQLGCYLSSTGDVNWQTTVYCRVTWLCF
ncbi:MAG TPA: hypothetical protein VGM13_11205 [Thermoanaerobaculia bacterium]|jgi:hypothetical protein